MEDKYPFGLTPLPYAYDGLEPYIDMETVRIHHDKHFKKYVDNLNEIISNNLAYESWSLEKLILNNNKLPPNIQVGVKNNAGGVYNHRLYFDIMTLASEEKKPVGNLKEAINKSFESYENFKKLFKEAAIKVFGSGYAWLVLDKSKELKIVTSPNQDVPLNVFHILLIDVWEHAYYLKYQNKRDEYIINWFNLIDWNKAEEKYNNAIKYLNNPSAN